jgi:TonB-dependent receptor
VQDVKSHDLFDPATITSQSTIDHADLLPSANVTWSVTPAINVRAAASRTLSRPDLNELSPSPTLEYVAGYQIAGNPNLDRAVLTNYDVRVEAFPSVSEVLAVGYFYKDLKEPIEQSIQGGVPPLLTPLNSDHGYNRGLEFEARAALGRYWGRLRRLSINANATTISSSVTLKPQPTSLSDQVHPLQGQAAYTVNGGLTYSTPSGHTDVSILVGAVGKRLRTLGYLLPDIYDQPTTTLDAAANFTPLKNLRLKLAARNLSQKRIQQLQGSKEVSGYVPARTFTAALVFGL